MLCPKTYYANCHNAGIRCKNCLAGPSKSSKVLHYDPIDTELSTHPCADDSDKRKKRKILQRSKDVEKNVKDSIAKGTIASGSVRGDGDLSLLQGKLRTEVKDRGSRASWNLTWDEYTKGQRQSIDIYAISVICPDGQRRTLYMLEEHLFNEWLAAYKKLEQD